MMGIKQQWLVIVYMQWLRITAWRGLSHAAIHPARAQKKVLKRILRQHSGTTIGQQYVFDTFATVDAYRAAVPIHDYEALRPAIERQAAIGEPALTEDAPVHYLLTSGTTGKPKSIPLTKKAKRQLRQCQKLASYGFYQQAPLVFSGKMLGIAADATEGITPQGVTYGSMSGVLQDSMSRFMARRSVLAVAAEGQSRYEAVARKALGTKNISVAITANPSTLMRLKEVMLEKGLIGAGATLGSLWPSIQAILTWTHGNCSHYLPALRSEFPEASILEIGYLSSEFYGTIPVGGGQCVPSLGQYFFEFAAVDSWDGGNRATRLLHELEQGKRYYIIVTSGSGLYRYFIDDIVEVTGWFRRTPCLRFVQKGKDVTSLTGEKLYESQLILAMESIWAAQDIPTFFLALAHAEPAHYALYVEGGQRFETSAKALDDALANANIEYQAKRESGRLLPLQLIPLKMGAGSAYRSHVARNQRDAQLKLRRLAYAKECDFDFTPFLLEAA